MNYGQIFGDSFRILWRAKKLWLFGLIGLALSSVLGLVVGLASLNFQSTLIEAINRELMRGGGNPERIMGTLFGGITTFFLLMGLALMGSLVAYLVNLAMRAGSIVEATRAWRGESVSLRRGAREGVGSMPGFFGVDLLWAIVPTLVIVGVYGLFIGSIVGLVAASESAGMGEGAALGFVGGAFLLLCCLLIFFLIYGIFYAIFAPMMYQALAQGRLPFAAALSQAWSLGKANAGSLFLFALLVWGLGLLLSIVVQMVSTPFMGLFMGSWMEEVTRSLEQGIPVMPTPNYALMIPSLLLITGLSYLTTSFMQSFNLTLYAKVYSDLTAPGPQEDTSAGAQADTGAETLIED